jgi:opacity protein-like surface antigen
MDNGTNGSLKASELFPTEEWGRKIDTGYMKVASSQQKVDAWWDNLNSAEQKNPVNIAKHETANAVLQKTANILDAASQVTNNASESSIQYSLDKKPKDMWNFIIGTQFQINKSWMIRAEYGFLGTRQQFIGGLQYRFGL